MSTSTILRVSQAWFEDFGAGCVTSASFAARSPALRKGDSVSAFRVPDFVVGTNHAFIIACTASSFEELDPERRCAPSAEMKINAAILTRIRITSSQ